MAITKYYSSNFNIKPRSSKSITAIIIHYTGMQSERESLKKLISPKSKVSCHYLINRRGIVFSLVKEKNIAWHAGKSMWGKYKNLNKNSIGIELVNKGHKYGYQAFTKIQIKKLVQLCKNYLYFEMPYKAALVLEKEMATGRIDSTLESLNMLVDAWILAQESEKAESVFNEIINSYNDEKSRLRLGQLHIENEKWEKAVDILNIELESEDLTLISKINLLLGIAQFNTENIAEARISFTQALSDKSTKEQAEWWLDHIKRKDKKT